MTVRGPFQQARERSADPKSGDERAESPTVARPQADERDPGADGPHECAEGLATGAPTSMTCLTPTYALTPN